jgi:hypothetical protein
LIVTLNVYFSTPVEENKNLPLYKYEYSFNEDQNNLRLKETLPPASMKNEDQWGDSSNQIINKTSSRREFHNDYGTKTIQTNPYLILKEEELEKLVHKYPDHFKNLSKKDYLFFMRRFPENKDFFSIKDKNDLPIQSEAPPMVGPIEPVSHLGNNPYLYDIEKSFKEPNFYLMLTETDITMLVNNFPQVLENLKKDDYDYLVESFPVYKGHFFLE